MPVTKDKSASVKSDAVSQLAQMVTTDDWELNPVKACRIDNPDCEACQ